MTTIHFRFGFFNILDNQDLDESARLIKTSTWRMLIPDITKTSSNNCFLIGPKLADWIEKGLQKLRV